MSAAFSGLRLHKTRQIVRAHDAGPTMVRVVAVCPECGERFRSPAFDESRLKELETRHVQDVFPDWSPSDRELYFMTGICDACWDRIMAPSEEDDIREEVEQ